LRTFQGEPEGHFGDRPELQECAFKELTMKNILSRFLKDDSGATAIEYGLIAAGISVAIIAVVNGLGTKLNTNFSTISTQLK
jgi:pilus assembly protein Flp/PilA